MAIELSPREETQILAALRFWQSVSRYENLADNEYEAYFEAHESLSSEEIDALCDKLAFGGEQT